MKKKLSILLFFLSLNLFFSQSCQETIDFVKSKGTGITYYSSSSKAISQVTFYNLYIDYKTYYFAIVKFTSDYYKEYIYLVGSNTQYNYSLNYLNGAGEAFWKYIAPYNKNLGCAPNFD